jgi:LysR family glycine cleavage system transcriptional activator
MINIIHEDVFMIDRRTLPLAALRAFESAAQYLHMGKAGSELGVTQGAISHQVRLLEERLGVALFSRAHNTLALTPAGIRLLTAVSQGLDLIIDGARNLDPKNINGSLVIGCTETIATSWAAQHICSFYEKYPEITITVAEIEPLQKVISHDIDIAICYGRPDTDERQLTKIGAPTLFPVCSPTLLNQGSQRIRLQELSSFTLIHDGQVAWVRWMEQYGVDMDSIHSNIYFPSTSQAIRAATLGAGIALSNTLEAQQFIIDGQLVKLFDKPIDEEHSYYLMSPAARNNTTKAQIFIEWILNACNSKFS